MISRKMNPDYQPNFEAGEVILIDKPFNLSSFRVIEKVRKLINFRKIGHAGTLDPLATGLLILCTGKKTKEITKYQQSIKRYIGIFTLGYYSESYDKETELKIFPIPNDITEEKILTTAQKFIGEIKQLPPMYSAIKVNGKRLYQSARKGLEVQRNSRVVTIYNFFIDKIDLPDIHFTVECSKGTYIRALADDFGKELGTRAILSSLRRTKIGDFDVEDALELEEFSKLFSQKITVQ
ncbi:MAG: tRNA pseudouridine(55) synthase TruB [Ignavibacterium sp.]|nr:tRNA pseudouridine(55) synthase TruB [Ignavibacterium sp.]MDW8375296.1 tRNA pseudouridine(55) synthase TruB [Ignavibacteriales bacterium]